MRCPSICCSTGTSWRRRTAGSRLAARCVQREEGFEVFVGGFNDYYRLTAGAGVGRPYYLTLYAFMLGRLGRVQEGLDQVDQAEQQIAQFGEEWPLAEVLRVKGELRATMAGAEPRAEECYRRAIEVAQRHHAKSWELRAATSLARLLRQQGRHTEARDVLAPVYGWFTEGFQRLDLLEAKMLLDTAVKRYIDAPQLRR